MTSNAAMGIPKDTQDLPGVRYSDKSDMHTMDICVLGAAHRARHGKNAVWVVYIHGGAWRDPMITSQSFLPTRSRLLDLNLPIAGFASIEYPLSPYPNHPTHPSSPTDVNRNAKHPEHLEAVRDALAYLIKNYDLSSGYVLCGHSCGATLAFQAATWAEIQPRPSMVLGVCGIYNIPGLVSRHGESPIYREIVEGAFGHDEKLWYGASPVNFPYWPGDGEVVLAYSPEDGLVEDEQVEDMKRTLQEKEARLKQGDNMSKEKAGLGTEGKVVRLIQLRGQHDEIWKSGLEMARAIEFTIRKLL